LKPLAPLYTAAERAALPGVGLYIIDMQAYMLPVVAPERVFPAMLALVEAAEKAGSPVAWAYMNELGNGMGSKAFELAAPLVAKPGHLQVLKYGSNAFNGSGIVGMFDRAGVGTVVIGGMSSEGCVDSTIAGALKLGYKVVVAEEAHTTGEGGSLENLERMNRVWRRLQGVEVLPAAAVRFRAGAAPAAPAGPATGATR
ncbi:MAG: cysteine hydrolase, partial [Spirochaetaceae bacterium]|nr:cysteine hydrolase [Spirochaetaceae bacterium]